MSAQNIVKEILKVMLGMALGVGLLVLAGARLAGTASGGDRLQTCPTCRPEKLDTILRNQHELYRAITNHDHYLREWTRPVEF
jgi:hypothetical protein